MRTERRGGGERETTVYPVGTAVDVAYDPAKPAAAMLEPGNAAGSLTLTILGVVFAVLGLAVLVAGFA